MRPILRLTNRPTSLIPLRLNRNRTLADKALKKAEFILTTIIGTILLWVTVFVTIDIFDFLDDKETYSKVHHLDMNQKGFEWDYLQRNILLISIGLLGLIVIGLRFTKPNNNGIKKINFGLIGLILLTATIKLVRLLMSDI